VTVQDEELVFERFRRLFSETQADAGTGDLSLDALLRAMDPPLADLVRRLSVPHWFDDEILRSVRADLAVDSSPEDDLNDVARLPFVLPDVRGWVYHDAVRTALHAYLVRAQPETLRRTSRIVSATLESRHDEADEFTLELVYLMLAYDERGGLEAMGQLFEKARRERRLTLCDTLVQTAMEQRGVLSSLGQIQIDLFQAILAFDLHHWEETEELLSAIPFDNLPLSVVGRVQVRRGMALEARGLAEDAERVYSQTLDRLNSGQDDSGLRARLQQRLASVQLARGDLRLAEEHVRKSLKVNEATGDLDGQAANFELLGAIYARAGELRAARDALKKSLELLKAEDRVFDQSRIFNQLADLYLDSNQPDQARDAYERAEKVRIDAADNYGLAFVYAGQGKLSLTTGDTENALRHLGRSLELFERFKDRVNAAATLRSIALIREQRGDLAGALDAMQQAESTTLPEHPLKPLYMEEVKRLEAVLEGQPDPLLKRGLSIMPFALGWVVIGILLAAVIIVILLLALIIAFGFPGGGWD